ncbi:MAG: DHHW family protein, partial [Candidatus Hydrogenedentota bacterium]
MMTRFLNITTIVLFAAMLWLPVLDNALDIDPGRKVNEQRAIATMEKLEEAHPGFLNLPTRIETFFNDRFGMRNSLIHWHNFIRVFGFRIGPGGIYDIPDAVGGEASRRSSSNVVVGQDGWLFFAGYDNRVLADHRGIVSFSEDELMRWKIRLLERRNYLRKRGIEYVFVMAPDKHSIYPEFLPVHVNQVSDQSRADQLVAYLQSETDLNIVDPRPALLEAKKSERIYHKTDTHWNALGAHVAYTEIMDALRPAFPQLQARPRSDYELTSRVTDGRDMAGFLALTFSFEENYIELEPLIPGVAEESTKNMLIQNPKRPKFFHPIAYETGNPDLPRAL